jgi:hypothetical protein
MSDALLLATIGAFFALAALLVWACGHITDGAVEDLEQEVVVPEPESGSPA